MMSVYMAELSDSFAGSDLVIFKSLSIYIESILEQGSSRRLDEFRDLVKQWEGRDALTSLANYRSVVGLMFEFLKDMNPLSNSHTIAQEISEILHDNVDVAFDQLVFILSDSDRYKALVSQRGDSAQQLVDMIQELLDLFPNSKSSPLLCKALLRLSRASALHPTCYPLRGLQRVGEQVAAGAFGDIWKGLVREHSVSVKIMRAFRDSDIKAILKEFGREALIWRQLSHPNLLPFYGLFYVEDRLCLISPWMENGHILHFLKNAPPETNRLPLILDVALGLEYLHGKQVVHGDLKGMNVLVTPSGRACITDFGLSSIANAMTLRFTHSTATALGGTARYQAPELLSGEQLNHFGSDIYAFACLCYEILIGKVPFFELPNDVAVSIKVIMGHRPLRPESVPANALWMLLQDCWAQSSEERPAITQVVERLVGTQIGAQAAVPAPTDWDDTFSSKFRRSLQDSPLLPSVIGIERKLFSNDVTGVEQDIDGYKGLSDELHTAPTGYPSKRPTFEDGPHHFEPLTVKATPPLRFGAWRGSPSSRSQREARQHSPLSGLNPDVTATIRIPGYDPSFGAYRRVQTDATAALTARRRRQNLGQFVCPLCGVSFTAKHNLKNHMHSHTGAKRYKCKCGQKFGTKHVLTRHARKCRDGLSTGPEDGLSQSTVVDPDTSAPGTPLVEDRMPSGFDFAMQPNGFDFLSSR